MKKILLVLCLALLAVSCKVSEPYKSKLTDEVLDGIFDLRFGMSIEDLKGIVDTTLLSENENYFHLYNKDGGILYGRRKAFYLKRYAPAYDFAIEWIDLYFFDDKLYEIEIRKYNNQTEDLLTSKYGTSKSKDEKYRNVEWKTAAEKIAEWDNVKSETKGRKIDKVWRTNSKDIECKSHYDIPESSSDFYYFRLKSHATQAQMYQEEWDYKWKKKQEEIDRQGGEKKTTRQLLDEL